MGILHSHEKLSGHWCPSKPQRVMSSRKHLLDEWEDEIGSSVTSSMSHLAMKMMKKKAKKNGMKNGGMDQYLAQKQKKN